MTVPKLDIFVNYDDPTTSLKEILKVIRPTWNLDLLQVKDLSSGYLNKNVGCYIAGQSDGVFVRMINAIREINMVIYKQISILLDELNLSPKLLAIFTNGVCSELVEGRTIGWGSRECSENPIINRNIIRAIAAFHTKEVLAAAEAAHLPDNMNEDPKTEAENSKFFEHIWTSFQQDPSVLSSYKDRLPVWAQMEEEQAALKRLMKESGSERVLCHMDVNPSNIIIKPDGSAVLLDYDLTSINYNSMDIAGYFHCFIDIRNPVMADYPDDDFRRESIRYYLQCRHDLDGSGSVTEDEVEKLFYQVEVARVVWMWRFTMAGPFMSKHSHVQDAEKIDDLYKASVKYYEEFTRLYKTLIGDQDSLIQSSH